MDTYFDEKGKEHKKPDKIQPTRRISGYAFIEESGNFLMVQPTFDERWELPGGGIEDTEAIKEGIHRECYEETGYQVEIQEQPIYVGESNFYCTVVDTYFKSIILVYAGRILSERQDTEVINAVEKDEIGKIAWIDPQELSQNNVRPIHWPAIRNMLPPQRTIKKGQYKHYKGKEYEVIALARHSETLEELVIYRALYGAHELWVRPLKMFVEKVEINGKRVSRFEYIGE